MNRRRLISRYLQLKHELARAYAHLPWNPRTLDRLTSELASLERRLAADPRPLAY